MTSLDIFDKWWLEHTSGCTVRCSYKNVSVIRTEKEREEFSIFLDSRPLCTPGGVPLVVSSYALAEAIAVEWQVQENELLHLARLPMTQLTNTAIDRGALLQQNRFDALLTFAVTDLVCYRASAPQILVRRQQTLWQPLLDWVAQHYNALLTVTIGVMPVPQPPAALAALRLALSKMDLLHLVGLHRAATLCSSLVIALALAKGKISIDVAFASAQLDTLFQIEQWGVDIETEAHHEAMYSELQTLARFITLLG